MQRGATQTDSTWVPPSYFLLKPALNSQCGASQRGMLDSQIPKYDEFKLF